MRNQQTTFTRPQRTTTHTLDYRSSCDLTPNLPDICKNRSQRRKKILKSGKSGWTHKGRQARFCYLSFLFRIFRWLYAVFFSEEGTKLWRSAKGSASSTDDGPQRENVIYIRWYKKRSNCIFLFSFTNVHEKYALIRFSLHLLFYLGKSKTMARHIMTCEVICERKGRASDPPIICSHYNYISTSF